jgi:hypothetical protein
MSAIVDLAEWRRARLPTPTSSDEGSPGGLPGDAAGAPAAPPPEVVDRLDRAIERLHQLVSEVLESSGRLQPRVETELLAIMGELTVGLIPEAASRAERLADRLAGSR